MKDLGIKSLNIIPDQYATIDSIDIGTIKILLNKENQSLQISTTASGSSSSKPILLSTPAIEMAKNLHELLLCINNLPDIPPTMNPINIDVKSYIQELLEKLRTLTKEEFEAEIKNQTDKNFLIIYNLKEKQDQRKEKEKQKD